MARAAPPWGRVVGDDQEVPMSDRVTVQITDGVADVRLNRPDKLNALDGDMFVALVDVSSRLARDASVRAVVLSGEGRAFSAGLDFSGFMAMAGGRGTVDSGGPADADTVDPAPPTRPTSTPARVRPGRRPETSAPSAAPTGASRTSPSRRPTDGPRSPSR